MLRGFSMKITADANILFAALLRKSATRRIWFNPAMELYAPKFLLLELAKYSNYLCRKSAACSADFQTLEEKLLSQVYFVEDCELKPYLPAASSLSKDKKDWLYLACALKEDTAIWSDDSEFKKQNRVKAMTTKEVIDAFGAL